MPLKGTEILWRYHFSEDLNHRRSKPCRRVVEDFQTLQSTTHISLVCTYVLGTSVLTDAVIK